MLDPLSLNEKGDAEWISILNDVTYFNLEVCHDYNSLVINASKQGIDAFLREYGELRTPPEVISFSKLQRPTRRWLSPEININEHPEVSDPTPYTILSLDSYVWNYLVPGLKVEFISREDAPILSAGIREGVPLLIVNQRGWETFLIFLHRLRDESHWFFVTASNPDYSGRSFFHLTTPYLGDSQDHIFRALEFIRLEPSEEIYLRIPSDGIRANCTGLLLFSKWLHDFVISEEKSSDLCNRWNKLPKTLSSEDNQIQPQWIHLCKINQELPYPLFSFERKEGDNDRLYIFGNSKGFQEIAEITEEYAFYSDHDTFYSHSPEQRLRGDFADRVLGPNGFHQQGLMLVGGGLFTPKYNPSRFIGTPANSSPYSSRREIKKNFVNDRILFQ